MSRHIATEADKAVAECLVQKRSFAVVAGAGAGKTASLVEALRFLLEIEGDRLLRDGQRVVCVTYTNRAADVIKNRLGQSPLFLVTTLHSFLWKEIRHFPTSIRAALSRCVIPYHIQRNRENDKGGKSKLACEARAKIAELERTLLAIDSVTEFHYGDDTQFSDFESGVIGHDDLILIAADMLQASRSFRSILSQRYPYILVDEAQDTSPFIVNALNGLCADQRLPIVGYFGDPMQQIHDRGVGEFKGPEFAEVITKEENFRSAPAVINLLNAFRTDVTQFPAGTNKSIEGSVVITLVQSESPAAKYNQYTSEQLQRANQRFDDAIDYWGWKERPEAKRLFLVWRMIARRLGFLELHDLFNGKFASNRAKNSYEEGEHYLVKPFVETIVPLIKAHRERDTGTVLRVLATKSPAFRPDGEYSLKSVRDVKAIAATAAAALVEKFASGSVGDVLRFCSHENLISTSVGLRKHLDRPRRHEEYDPDNAEHILEKEYWLADAFFDMHCGQLEKYCNFLKENTPYSTQHGVKGEEFNDVIVVFDDVEAAWNQYTFSKMLTPEVAGAPKDSQRERSRRLAYVCFSRAIQNLRILLFTPNPELAASELAARGYFQNKQINILPD